MGMEIHGELSEFHVNGNRVIHGNLNRVVLVHDVDVFFFHRNAKLLNFLPHILANLFVAFPVIAGETGFRLHRILKLIIVEVGRGNHHADKYHATQY